MLNVSRNIYQRVLYEAAVREGVKVRFGVRVDRLDETQLSVELSSGETFQADLIIGADGRSPHSTSFCMLSLLLRYQIGRTSRDSWK